DGGCWLSESAGDEAGPGRIVWHENLPAVVSARERAGDVRWVWAATDGLYPALLRAGVRVERCHDVALTEALLLARAGRFGEPASLSGAWAGLGGAWGAGLALGGAVGSGLAPRGAAGSGLALGGAAGSGLAPRGVAAPAAQAARRSAAAGQAVLFELADSVFPSPCAALEALVAVH